MIHRQIAACLIEGYDEPCIHLQTRISREVFQLEKYSHYISAYKYDTIKNIYISGISIYISDAYQVDTSITQ